MLLIIGILLTIAVPSYLSFKDRSYKTAATADVAQAMRSVVSYGADNYPNAPADPNANPNDNGYTGIDLPDPGDEVRRVDLDGSRRAVRDQPGRFRGIVHGLLLDGGRRTLDRGAARPRWRDLRRDAVHARYLHGQLTQRDCGAT